MVKSDMKVYKFKVKDYATILIGQRVESVFSKKNKLKEEGYFYIQRGDGNIQRYSNYRVEWSELIYSEEE